jgi:Family of unknown function (DUF6232)
MEEQIFYEKNNITVTNSRFISNGQTYAMSGVTSVKRLTENPKRGTPIFIGLIGLSLFAFHFLAGSIGIVVAVAIWMMQGSKYFVQLQTASGESRALESTDSIFIEEVIAALNQAIIARG